MCFEQLLLGLGLVEEVMSRPVTRGQSLKSFLQVVVLLKKLDDLPQLPLPTFDWSKPKKAATHQHERQASWLQTLRL